MNDDILYQRSTCAALVITCSDFRFKTAERALTEASGLADDYDLIARPGAIRSLVAPRSAAAGELMHDEVALLLRLHAFTRVLMVNHLSCRAYDDIATPDNEREVHTAHLREASAVIEHRYPSLTPEPYLLTVVGGAMRAERA